MVSCKKYKFGSNKKRKKNSVNHKQMFCIEITGVVVVTKSLGSERLRGDEKSDADTKLQSVFKKFSVLVRSTEVLKLKVAR